jgi:hypothetical protein
MPNCWLKVSLLREDPATSQLAQGFPWFTSVLVQVLASTARFTFIPTNVNNISPKYSPPNIK